MPRPSRILYMENGHKRDQVIGELVYSSYLGLQFLVSTARNFQLQELGLRLVSVVL